VRVHVYVCVCGGGGDVHDVHVCEEASIIHESLHICSSNKYTDVAFNRSWKLATCVSVYQMEVLITRSITGKLKVIILVPVLEGQFVKRSCVGKLQVGKVPVQDLTIARRKVHGTGGCRHIHVYEGKCMRHCEGRVGVERVGVRGSGCEGRVGVRAEWVMRLCVRSVCVKEHSISSETIM